MKGIAVTGMGVISSIGHHLSENLEALSSSKSGISFPEILQTTHTHLPVGEIKFNNTELSEILNLPKTQAYTRAALLGTFAVKELLKNLGWEKFPEETGFISGTSVGGIDATEKHFKQYAANSENNRFIQAQHPGFTTEKIAEYFELNSVVTNISTACSSSANAILVGARMIQCGRLKRVIVGGTDCLTKFTLNGFNSLKILSSNPCKPFDDRRDGLNLGEAAAYLMLEADDLVQNKPIARISGFGNANDAFHQTASSQNGEGAFLAMEKALKIAGLEKSQIDYINAHGTGTLNNDLSESMAIQRFFGEDIPLFSSTKAYTGHTLGAAGALEAIFSILSISENKIFPNLNFAEAMQETGYSPVSIIRKANLRHVLSNSLGFGGNCTSLIFSKDE
ncbi:beta-ketoacyl-[acyl-carrier-protein] synthase family protein [Gramella sp. AN32]|uniref:Beta-ketoacyl-[acyl-carrier-protein] synthase family protein n=1 Tax=Christiangramia antarctica TaxID=2058158 RepID=A0ABW5X0C3_9FLAO|nr:beta-ketoacyl-[acyl-carrier-protein] synthase family protein [Gramella sp. AN32]MCM4156761.1 beta-ketoacyl-[acyl-carrier-protein] synthase family protein [Gramella sp. AN32]